MIRQRVALRGFGFSEVILRLLVSVLALALIFYGAMVVLAALKLSPDTINSNSTTGRSTTRWARSPPRISRAETGSSWPPPGSPDCSCSGRRLPHSVSLGAVEVQVQLTGAGGNDDGDDTLLATLRGVQQHIRSRLADQGPAPVAVDVTLAGAPAPRISKETHS